MAKDFKKTLGKAFVENNADINEDEAADAIVRSEMTIRNLEEEMNNHDQLQAARQIVKDLEGSYKATIKYERAKIGFLLDKIEEIQNNEVNPTSGLADDEEA